MWVKICANTSLDDTLFAADSGADAVGFVFAPSTRRVTPETVAPISAHLAARYPALERIGVFISQDPVEIRAVTLSAGLTAVQLHGNYDVALFSTLRAALRPQISLISVLHRNAVNATKAGDSDRANGSSDRLDTQMSQLSQLAASNATDRVLIDSQLQTLSGGTGLTFDWSAAKPLLATAPRNLKLIVAGGLNPGNVAEAIGKLAPWGVDVASGVEYAPGKKSSELVQLFVQNSRRASN